MSPLERVIPLKEIAKIRVECGKCHTTLAFSIHSYHAGNIGNRCHYCGAEREDVEQAVISLHNVLSGAERVKNHGISLELNEAF